jgi:hypothetical protein
MGGRLSFSTIPRPSRQQPILGLATILGYASSFKETADGPQALPLIGKAGRTQRSAGEEHQTDGKIDCLTKQLPRFRRRPNEKKLPKESSEPDR